METTEGIANFFIQKSIDTVCADFTQLKLQKMVYYAHGWHLGLSGNPLFLEPVQAWRYGPVIQSLRREFREFGSLPITRKARDVKFANDEILEYEYQLQETEAISPFLSRIWEIYGVFTPIQLTNMTHEEGTPWHQIAAHYSFRIPEGITIPNNLIQSYFKAQAIKQKA